MSDEKRTNEPERRRVGWVHVEKRRKIKLVTRDRMNRMRKKSAHGSRWIRGQMASCKLSSHGTNGNPVVY